MAMFSPPHAWLGCTIAAALTLLTAAPALPAKPATEKAAAPIGIQLRLLPDCVARPDAEGCVQPAAATERRRQPEQIRGLSPGPDLDRDAGSAPVITRTW